MNSDALLLSSLTLILSAALSYVVAAKLARGQRRDEQRVIYLVDAYRRIEAASNHSDGLTPDQRADLEGAVSDVFLFGSLEQQRLVAAFAKEFAANASANADDILTSLRRDLRGTLRLADTGIPTVFLRLH